MATRTTTRTQRSDATVGATGERERRPAVRDFTGGVGGPVITWDVRPIYDFLFSLTDDAAESEDVATEDRRWVETSKASISADAKASIDWMRETELAVHVAAYVVEHRSVRTASDLIASLEAEGPAALLRAVMSETLAARPDARAVLDRALAGDAAAIDEFGTFLPDWKRTERLDLLRDPAGTHASVLRVIRAWAVAWAPIERRITDIIGRDHDLRSGDRATLPFADLIERTTGGVRWNPEPGVRRIVLAPSYFSRPYNFLLAGPDWRFFGYPVADEALERTDPLAPPPAVVRLHRALGDPTRMRILKLLSEKDLYLTEIAGLLDLSKPTIKHHLALLRAAGLVTVLEAGAVMYYSLRRDRLDDASADLKRFLVG